MKDVLQLTGVIVMASSDKKKVYDSKSVKTIRMKSFSGNSTVKLMMRPKPLYQKTRSVANISSEYTFSVRSKRSLEFLTL